jgi:hypothetical protein
MRRDSNNRPVRGRDYNSTRVRLLYIWVRKDVDMSELVLVPRQMITSLQEEKKWRDHITAVEDLKSVTREMYEILDPDNIPQNGWALKRARILARYRDLNWMAIG